jgi:hypothetical protein
MSRAIQDAIGQAIVDREWDEVLRLLQTRPDIVNWYTPNYGPLQLMAHEYDGSRKWFEIVDTMIQLGVSPNAVGMQRHSPLKILAEKSLRRDSNETWDIRPAFLLLLQYGADPYAEDDPYVYASSENAFKFAFAEEADALLPAPVFVPYSGGVFDVIDGVDKPIADYLSEDPGNIVMIINGTRAFGLNRLQLAHSAVDDVIADELPDFSLIRYRCRPGSANRLLITPKDVDIKHPLLKINVPEPYLIDTPEMYSLLNSTAKIWLATVLPRVADRIASHNVISEDGGETNLEGNAYSVVGAAHCQDGSGPISFVRIRPAVIVLSGGRRSIRRTLHKSKRRSTRKSIRRSRSRSIRKRHT